MLTLDLATLPPNADGSRLILPGSILIRQANGLGRVLQGTRTAISAAAGATVITVRNASLFSPGQVLAGIGTIAAGGVDLVNNRLTLAAGLAAALPVNSTVFVTAGNPTAPYNFSANTEGVYGMTLSLIDAGRLPNDIALYTSASVFGARLPYWDSNLQAAFPEITIV
jgi:hypothetical protein